MLTVCLTPGSNSHSVLSAFACVQVWMRSLTLSEIGNEFSWKTTACDRRRRTPLPAGSRAGLPPSPELEHLCLFGPFQAGCATLEHE